MPQSKKDAHDEKETGPRPKFKSLSQDQQRDLIKERKRPASKHKRDLIKERDPLLHTKET